MSFPISDILTTIRDLAVNELGDLGDTETAQDAAIFRFVNVVLRKRVKQANNVQWSDTLNIAANGYQSFLVGGSAITNQYQPMMVWDVSGASVKSTPTRTSFESPKGWFRESDNQLIHTNGLTGNHKLQYIRYPVAVAASTDLVEMPLSGQWDLIFDVIRMCKLPKNYIDEADALGKQATGTATVKASIAAQGKGSPNPTLLDREG